MSSIDDRVRQLRDLEVTLEPDTTISLKTWIKRKIIVEDYLSDIGSLYGQTGRGIIIRVRPEGSSSDSTFKASYPRSYTGRQQLEELKRFIDSIKGQEAHIVYTQRTELGIRSTVLQMIAPILETTIYVKGDKPADRLLPYTLKTPIKMMI